MEPESIDAWIGKEDSQYDLVTAHPLTRLAAILDHTPPPSREDRVPPLGHWLYALPATAHSDLSEDGHPKLGRFLPPIGLPRRMWASSSIEFLAPLHVGDSFRRRSLIKAIERKLGRSGELVFVTLQHEVRSCTGLAIRETQQLVYRGRPVPVAGPPEPCPGPSDALPSPDWQRTIRPEPTLLFRFSAVTFNSHRIHYDRDYARDVEGYPGLVVHGPLVAMLLMDLFLRNHPQKEVATFRFKAMEPLFDLRPFSIAGVDRGGSAELWALTPDQRLALRAELTYT
jgi:3-methylfumaryl-CoA hydratase